MSSSEPADRRTRKKQRTRREIYDAAIALFGARDFDSVTIAEICQKADVGRGTFFLHFPTKSALLYEFSERVAADFETELLEPRGSAVSELEALVDHIGAELTAHGDVMLVMLREFQTSPEALAVARESGWAFPDLITQIVERGQKRGEFRPSIDPRLAAAAVMSTAGAIVSGYVFGPGELTAEAIRAQFFELIFGGLVPA